MEKICQENRKRAEEETGEQSEERERCCCSVPVPHCWLPVVSMGTRSSGKVGQPGVVRHGCKGNGVAPGPGATGSIAFTVLSPRSTFLPNPAGGTEVPGLPPRELLLGRLPYECPRGRGG